MIQVFLIRNLIDQALDFEGLEVNLDLKKLKQGCTNKAHLRCRLNMKVMQIASYAGMSLLVCPTLHRMNWYCNILHFNQN